MPTKLDLENDSDVYDRPGNELYNPDRQTTNRDDLSTFEDDYNRPDMSAFEEDFNSPSNEGGDSSAPLDNLADKESQAQDNSEDNTNSASKAEKDSLGSFVKGGLGQFANSGPSARNLSPARKAKFYLAGAAAAFVLIFGLILFTFNVPAATVRAAANGITATYFGAQIMQGKIHFTKFWNGKIADGYFQSCVAGNCEITQKKTFLEKVGIRGAKQDLTLLKEKGISLMSENGKFIGIKIDAMKENSPYYDTSSEKTIREDFQKKTGLKDITVERVVGKGDTFTVKTGSKLTGFRNNALVASVMDNASHKNIYSKWSAVRQMGGILGLGFHPLMELRSKTANKVNTAVDGWMEGLLKKISGRGVVEPTVGRSTSTTLDDALSSPSTTSETGKLSYQNMKTIAQQIAESKTAKVSGGALMVAGGICMMSSVLNGADALKIQNFDRPAGALASNLMSAGDQTSAVYDPQVDSEGTEALITTMLEKRDKNGNIISFSDSAAWNNQNGISGGKPMTVENAIPAGIVNQETTKVTTLGVIADLIKSAEPVCGNPAVSAALTGGGIALMILSGPFGIAEGIIVGAVMAVGANAATQMMAGSPLDVKALADNPAELYNVASAGGKNNADTIAFTHGGDPQTGEAFNDAKASFVAEQKQEFQSHSLAYRLFNMNDPLSPANKVAINSSKYMDVNLARLTTSFVNILPSIGSSMARLLTPKTHAALKYDPCAESRYGCTGLSDAVMNNDASAAIDYLNTNPATDAAPLKYMRECRDNDFFLDTKLGAWTYKIVDGLLADAKRKTNKLPAECNSQANLNDPLINSLKAYVSLEPMLAGRVCYGADDSSADELDKSACQKVGYGSPAANQASTTDTGSGSVNTSLPNKDGWVWPVPGKTVISFPYGVNGCGGSGCGPHKGIDIPGPIGTPVVAAHDGKIVATSGGCQGTYLIQATGTSVYFAYQHLQQPVPKSVGATVKAGETIGMLGPIGNCGTGPHLHFSIELTQHVSIYIDSKSLSTDPMGYLPKP